MERGYEGELGGRRLASELDDGVLPSPASRLPQNLGKKKGLQTYLQALKR